MRYVGLFTVRRRGLQPHGRDHDGRWNGLPLLVERLLLAVGVGLLAFYVFVRLDGVISSRRALREFPEPRAPFTKAVTGDPLDQRRNEGVDFGLWSPKRVAAYRDSLLIKTESPLAVLRLEKLDIHVPVYEGTDDLVLNRGVGWIAGTARPGEPGNIGIAGHRDGFFRGLKDISLGETIELSTQEQTAIYMVDHLQIVNPEDVGVLRPRALPSVTLVTCYPFYFFGDAPQRFIVHATLSE